MSTNASLNSQTRVCPSCEKLWGKYDHYVPPFCLDCLFPLLLVGGQFSLEKKLTAGGFGVVYIAKDTINNIPVVIKTLKPDILDDEVWNLRFDREIRVTSLLAQKNPHIVKVLREGKEKGMGRYYAMEYLQGETLAQYIRRSQPLPFTEIFDIFKQLCNALEDAHQEGVVHRDLKPENIFLIEENSTPNFLKILDFGIAKSLWGTANPDLTKKPLGTPVYMAPEQFLNKKVDPRTDIYTTGLLLYELLTRTQPFNPKQSSLRKLLQMHLTETPSSLYRRRPEIEYPQGLNEALLQALEKKPRERYQTIQDFWQALEPFASADGAVPPLVLE